MSSPWAVETLEKPMITKTETEKPLSKPFQPESSRMSLDPSTVRRMAKLARIDVLEEDLPRLAEELSSIVGWVEKLNTLDVDGVSPLTSVVAVTLPLRPDAVTDGNIRSDILSNAPEHDDEFFLVPKVVTT